MQKASLLASVKCLFLKRPMKLVADWVGHGENREEEEETSWSPLEERSQKKKTEGADEEPR